MPAGEKSDGSPELTPLGLDPATGLPEFADSSSGAVPVRGPDGRLSRTSETGLVFIRIPGGRFVMGASPRSGTTAATENFDSEALADEAPPRSVALDAFLISKYEMTQSQWLHWTGGNPSGLGPGREFYGQVSDLRHPVESVSWERAVEVLHRHGFRLPTEAQWEYAARAGTGTPWWTGRERTSLRGAANLADRFLISRGGPPGWEYDEWLDDGYAAHAPVGSFRANGFGLHDTVGNVAEWCADSYSSYQLPPRPADGLRFDPASEFRVARGGSYRDTSEHARSSSRAPVSPGERRDSIGLRPARPAAE